MKLSLAGDNSVSTPLAKCVITAGESDADFTSFTDAAAGGAREYRLEFTAAQDLSAQGTGYAGYAVWDDVWLYAGQQIAFKVAPYGNTTATATEPHFTGTAIISEPDGDLIGGEADASSSARMTFDCSWVLVGKPLRVTTGTIS